MSFVQTTDGGASLFCKDSSTAREEGQPISFRGHGGGANDT
jgi:hypothetical protein